jgi:predicted HTH domain antitoxin
MSSIRSKNTRNSIETEGRIELAVSAIKNEEKIFLREATTLYDVLYSTLRYRLKKRLARAFIRVNSHKFTESEENLLVQ